MNMNNLRTIVICADQASLGHGKVSGDEGRQLIAELEMCFVDEERLEQYLEILEHVLDGKPRYVDEGFLANQEQFDAVCERGLTALDNTSLVRSALNPGVLRAMAELLADDEFMCEEVYSKHWCAVSAKFGRQLLQQDARRVLLAQGRNYAANDLTPGDLVEPDSTDIHNELAGEVTRWAELLYPEASAEANAHELHGTPGEIDTQHGETLRLSSVADSAVTSASPASAGTPQAEQSPSIDTNTVAEHDQPVQPLAPTGVPPVTSSTVQFDVGVPEVDENAQGRTSLRVTLIANSGQQSDVELTCTRRRRAFAATFPSRLDALTLIVEAVGTSTSNRPGVVVFRKEVQVSNLEPAPYILACGGETDQVERTWVLPLSEWLKAAGSGDEVGWANELRLYQSGIVADNVKD